MLFKSLGSFNCLHYLGMPKTWQETFWFRTALCSSPREPKSMTQETPPAVSRTFPTPVSLFASMAWAIWVLARARAGGAR